MLPALVAVALIVGACSVDRPAADASGGGEELWRTATLRDVLTGDDFTIADLEGTVVAIQPMAIWCVSCRTQQAQARAALDDVDSTDVVYLSLDIDPNERAEDLVAYARREGYGWRFVVASADVSRSLAATFGDQVLSPPATPLVVLGPDGSVVARQIGITGADELAALFREHLP